VFGAATPWQSCRRRSGRWGAGLIRQHPKVFQGYWDVVARRTKAAGLPVLANVEAGHADPMVTLPLGVEAELDAGREVFRLLEAPTVARS